jgi:hypothetical protein
MVRQASINVNGDYTHVGYMQFIYCDTGLVCWISVQS